MDKYIHESLTAGIICPSSSLAGAGFFFIEKKEEESGLQNVTSALYQLPRFNWYNSEETLITAIHLSTLELLQGTRIFSKLNLHNTYILV